MELIYRHLRRSSAEGEYWSCTSDTEHDYAYDVSCYLTRDQSLTLEHDYLSAPVCEVNYISLTFRLGLKSSAKFTVLDLCFGSDPHIRTQDCVLDSGTDASAQAMETE